MNFDDVTAPCYFDETVPLTKAYASQGVLFKGPSKKDGGAILNECSNFGVSGYSSPNFLAFNVTASYDNGGVARGPERITFTGGPMSHVQLRVGSGSGGKFTLKAYNASGHRIASIKFMLTSALKPASISATGIAYVKIAAKAPDWVIDDLSAS